MTRPTRCSVNLAVLVLSLGLLFAFDVGPSDAVESAEVDWQIGLAQASITPTDPVRLSGCASRDTPSEGVAGELFAKVLHVLDSKLDPVHGPLKIAHEDDDLPLQWRLSRPEIEAPREGGGGWRRFVADQLLHELEKCSNVAVAHR